MHSQGRAFNNCIHCSFHCNFKGKHEYFTWKDRKTDTLCGQSLLHTFCTHTSGSSRAMQVINLKVKNKSTVKAPNEELKRNNYKKRRRGKPKEKPKRDNRNDSYRVRGKIKHDNMIYIQVESPGSQVGAHQCGAISIITFKPLEVFNPGLGGEQVKISARNWYACIQKKKGDIKWTLFQKLNYHLEYIICINVYV